jgi:pimeloyl-ACP methyl ester carboxylesterase
MKARFNRRVLALLAGGLMLGVVVPPEVVAEAPPAGINQSSFVSIGGIDQWISIQGEDRRNPVLLVVHGGPGEAQWMAADKYEPWEKAFTVVQWDQRGAGHTYGRYGTQTPDVTLDRIVKDGIEVADCSEPGFSVITGSAPLCSIGLDRVRLADSPGSPAG